MSNRFSTVTIMTSCKMKWHLMYKGYSQIQSIILPTFIVWTKAYSRVFVFQILLCHISLPFLEPVQVLGFFVLLSSL